MAALEDKVLSLLNQNRRETDGHIYTLPSPENYPYQWLWDSCFHAIVLSHLDPKRAKQEIFSLLFKQFPNGMLPHMIYWDKNHNNKFVKIDWGEQDTSSITQPPIIAQAVWKIFQADKDLLFLQSVYPNLKHFYKYLLRERDSRGNHLIGIINPDESGEDNSPRFDLALKSSGNLSLDEHFKLRVQLINDNKLCQFDAKACMKNFFWVKDLPFNVFIVLNLEIMSKIAKKLKHNQDANFFQQEAWLVKQAIKQYMFSDGLYWSVYQANHEEQTDYTKIKVKTWAIFAPLLINLYSQKEAENLVDEHLLNKQEFWLKYPVPTVSKDEPTFDPIGFWRGPAWMGINWFIFQGLLNYGFKDIAEVIFEKSLELIESQGFREYYNPKTGEGLGATNFTWGTLVLDMEKALKTA